jgi:uncharacterized protein
MSLTVQTVSNGIVIAVKVVPNASRDQIVGLLGSALKIKVAQPPEGGRANRAVERLLADACGLPASSVKVVAGETNAQKRVLLVGGDAEMVATLVK